MEQLLHYCWKHKMFPLGALHTTDGQPVEVIDAGLHNRNAGPDFFNAKVKIGGELWVGNVEIHDKSTDWFLHGHERDDHYNNVVLHVAGVIDAEVRTASGLTPPQMQLDVPETVRRNYEELLKADNYPPCYKIVPTLSRIRVHSWMSALETERLERKTDDIARRAACCQSSWEAAYFVTMARNYGFGINGDAMEQWAMNVPLGAVGHHRETCSRWRRSSWARRAFSTPCRYPNGTARRRLPTPITSVWPANTSTWRISLASNPSTTIYGAS